MPSQYWLIKSEPSTFSFTDLKDEKNSTTCWDGVRNYQARNYMRDEMRVGDLLLFYHSNCKEPAVVGIAEVVREAYTDHTATDLNSPYYDKKTVTGKNPWMMVDVRWQKEFNTSVTLKKIKEEEQLKNMKLVQKGNRLSIIPVSQMEYEKIVTMGE